MRTHKIIFFQGTKYQIAFEMGVNLMSENNKTNYITPIKLNFYHFNK